jgi:hypothetical protein
VKVERVQRTAYPTRRKAKEDILHPADVELGDFLKARRTQLTPRQDGLPDNDLLRSGRHASVRRR